MLRTQIYLPTSQVRFLKMKSFQENISISEAIRRIIARETKRVVTNQAIAEKQNVGDWLLSLASQAQKLKARGPADLAKNLDEHLYGGK